MTIKTAARTRRTAAKAVSTAAAPRRARKAAATAPAEQKLYTIHSLDEMTIDTRVRRVGALDEAGARELTEQIRRTTVRLWLLVTEAHDRKAHIAMGYETWADYVKAELHMSESRSYQFLDTGHVMKALAAGGVDIETSPVPPTRVVARVKDRLTDVRKVAEKAAKGENGEQAKAVDQGLRALAREPRLKGRPRGVAAAQAKAAEAVGAGGQAAEAEGQVAQVTCPACKGSGKVGRDLAGVIRDLMKQARSG